MRGWNAISSSPASPVTLYHNTRYFIVFQKWRGGLRFKKEKMSLDMSSQAKYENAASLLKKASLTFGERELTGTSIGYTPSEAVIL